MPNFFFLPSVLFALKFILPYFTTKTMTSNGSVKAKEYSMGARWIHPISTPPLENHFINVVNDVIVTITPSPKFRPVYDFGSECRILPAVVNAHTHLELSQLTEPIPVPVIDGKRSFAGWIRDLVAFRRSERYNAEEGIGMALLRPEVLTETALLADIVPLDLLRHENHSPPDTHRPKRIRFGELIGWNDAMSEAVIQKTEQILIHNRACGVSQRIGLSPHAPQTVTPLLLEKTVELANRFDLPITMHLAESEEEMRLCRYGDGPIFEMMRNVDPDYAPKRSVLPRPMDYLKILSKAKRVMIVHGNFLDRAEIELLASQPERFAVVVCPRSYRHFVHHREHRDFPLRKMLDAGIPVAIGTDSPASSPDLNVLGEIGWLHELFPDMPLDELFRLCTRNGAAALGFDPHEFSLAPDTPARFAFFLRTCGTSRP